MELRLGNLCNLKCVMCSPENSSRYDDYEILFPGSRSTTSAGEALPRCDVAARLKQTLKHVELLVFRGGEPLINPNHPEVLNTLIRDGRAGSVALIYNTNGTHLPDQLKEYWSQFKSVCVWVSIDGLAEVNEFIRYPSSWKQIEQNMIKLDAWAEKIPALAWGVTSTLQAYNALELTRLLSYLERFSFTVRFPFLNLLHEPLELQITALPSAVRRKAVRSLQDWINAHSEALFEHGTPLTRKLNAFKGVTSQTIDNLERARSLVGFFKLSEEFPEAHQALLQVTRNILRTRKLQPGSFLAELGLLPLGDP